MAELLAAETADHGSSAGPSAPDRAAWTTAARVLLNLDEFITRE
jgi:hypothetical protein